MNKISKISTLALFGLLAVASTAGCSNEHYDFNMWSGFGATYSSYLSKLITFEKDKSGTSIKLENISGYDNLQKAINESVTTMSYPSIANGYPDHFAGYIRSQIQEPLNEYIAAYDAEHGVDLISDYYEDYMKENKSLLFLDDGTPAIMGLPFNKSTELLGYNGYFVDYVKSLHPDFVLPQTWQEWAVVGPTLRAIQLDMCGKYLHGTVDEAGNASNFTLNTTDGDDVVLDMSKVTPETCRLMSWDATDNMFITIVRQWGGVYTSYTEQDMKMANPHGWAEFNNLSVVNSETGETVNSRERTIAALTFFNGLFGSMSDVNTQIFGLPASFGAQYSSDAFKANKVLFTVCSSGGLSYNTGGKQRFRVAPIPYYDDGVNARKYVISQGTNLALFDQGTSETKKKAFEAIVTFTTDEAQARWACDTGYFPGSRSATQHPIYQEMLSSTDYSNVNIVAYRESAQVNENEYMNTAKAWQKFVDPGFLGSSKIRTVVKDIMSSVFNYVNSTAENPKTYEQVLKDAYASIGDGLTHNLNENT